MDQQRVPHYCWREGGREAKRQRGKEAKRQRGKEAKRQRGKEAKRQRGKEAKRQRGKEAKRQRGKEAKRQRGEGRQRGKEAERKGGKEAERWRGGEMRRGSEREREKGHRNRNAIVRRIHTGVSSHDRTAYHWRSLAMDMDRQMLGPYNGCLKVANEQACKNWRVGPLQFLRTSTKPTRKLKNQSPFAKVPPKAFRGHGLNPGL